MKFNFKKSYVFLAVGILSASTLLGTTYNSSSVSNASDVNVDVSLKTNISNNSISQKYVIKPTNQSQGITMNDVKLRFHYDTSDNNSFALSTDSAGLNLNVSPYYSDYSKNVKSKFDSKCLEISFDDNYNLKNGSLDLSIRFYHNDWSNINNFKEKKLEVMYKDEIVDTKLYDKTDVEPTVKPTQAPTVAPTVKPTQTPTIAPTQAPSGCVLPKCDVDKDGPFAVTIEKGTGPARQGWIVRPTNLGTNGVTKHPVFIWNPGGGDPVSQYESQMKRWASQGFVIYSEESQWSGDQCPKALDWLFEQNQNPNSSLYNKLDTTRFAAGGFSLGSVGTYNVAADKRIKTTIHCDGGSFDGKGNEQWRNPTCVMNGLNDGGLASDNTERDYNQAKVPIWYGGIIGGGHGSTIWDGLDAVTGWLRWQLAGDESLKGSFLTPSGRFNNGIYKSKWKNWN